MMLTSQKHLFDLDDSITYLNGAYMSPQLKSVTAAGVIALGMKSDPQQIQAADFFFRQARAPRKICPSYRCARSPQYCHHPLGLLWHRQCGQQP